MFANSNSSSEVSIDLIPDPVEEEKEPEIDHQAATSSTSSNQAATSAVKETAETANSTVVQYQAKKMDQSRTFVWLIKTTRIIGWALVVPVTSHASTASTTKQPRFLSQVTPVER